MELYHGFVDRPKLLGDQAANRVRRPKLREPHITQLTDFVEALRQEAGPGASIPNLTRGMPEFQPKSCSCSKRPEPKLLNRVLCLEPTPMKRQRTRLSSTATRAFPGGKRCFGMPCPGTSETEGASA